MGLYFLDDKSTQYGPNIIWKIGVINADCHMSG